MSPPTTGFDPISSRHGANLWTIIVIEFRAQPSFWRVLWMQKWASVRTLPVLRDRIYMWCPDMYGAFSCPDRKHIIFWGAIPCKRRDAGRNGRWDWYMVQHFSCVTIPDVNISSYIMKLSAESSNLETIIVWLTRCNSQDKFIVLTPKNTRKSGKSRSYLRYVAVKQCKIHR